MSNVGPLERRILIIDDNRAVHDDFQKILADDDEAAGLDEMEAEVLGERDVPARALAYGLDHAHQGRTALEMVVRAKEAGRPYHVAFVDMRMPPGWDGIETVERIWKEDPDLQVVICTAYSDYSWSELFTRLGGGDNLLVLRKPFDTSEVQQLAAALTQKRHLAAQAALTTHELERAVEQRTAELREKEKQLHRKQRLESVGSLAGGVAHEFNNLLQAIQGFTKFAMEQLPPEGEPYRDLTQVVDAADRAAAITRQLLDFSRRQPVERTSVELADLVSSTADMLQPVLGEHVQLDARNDAPEPTAVMADPGAIEQALMNLCINARDAMPSGGRIRIRTTSVVIPSRRGRKNPRPNLKPGPYAVLAVEDEGFGMTPDVVERIFDPFFTTKEVGQGTGLGLATVFGIVEQHDGAILVDSEPGKGTTFKIYLPVETSAAPEPLPTDEKPRGGSETILIAEDEQVIRQVAARILNKAGYATVQAEDGEQAVRLLAERRDEIAAVLLDVVMPGMSGREVYRHMRQEYPEMKAAFCTGYDPDARQVSFIQEEEGVPLVQKPFSSNVLLRTVRELLDGLPAPSLSSTDFAAHEAVGGNCK